MNNLNATRFKLNYKGVGELLKNKDFQNAIGSFGKDIASRCGSGYKSDVYVGRYRVNSMVWASSSRARRDNIKNNTILKAVK